MNYLKPGGTLMLAGLLDTQSQTLREHYADRIKLEVADEREGWVCLRGTLAK